MTIDCVASDLWHIPGIMRELTEGFEALAYLPPLVAILGSSRARPGDTAYRAAVETARLLSRAGFGIITGGGPGIMEAANQGAQLGGNTSVGCTIELPIEEKPNAYLDIALGFRSFFVRKTMFIRYAQAFIVFPGGFGTMDELFEVLVLMQTRKIHPVPVISVLLWALVDAFLFSAFKYEEASVLATIFPLNFVFTFLISVLFFHTQLKLTIAIGFLIIMVASLLIGWYHTHLHLSKGIVFALLYSVFLGAALGVNSEVVKSFSIPPYMVAAFLFPAAANLLLFLRPKRGELRHELKVQWKAMLLNAAVMDLSFFFLLKAFQVGNVPQVVALSASSTLLTAVAGIVFLKEDRHKTLKILAAALATLGVILVQL